MATKLRAAKAAIPTRPPHEPPRPGTAYPLRRRPKQIAAGAALMVVCALLAAVLFNQAGSRRDVVALARPVERFHVLERADLTTVRIAADHSIDLAEGASIDDLVGRATSMPVADGALLGEAQLLPADQPAVSADQQIVGVLLGAGASPVELREGMGVRLVIRPPANALPGEASEPVTIDGAWLYDVGDASSAGERDVSVVVAASSAPAVAAASAEKRVSLIVAEL